VPPRIIPDDDLYARLELTPDASPEAVEVAWRALLKRHHPDVAGDDAAALDRAKRINVAHDWLGDPELRALYDRERLGPPGPGSHGSTGRPAARTVRRPRPQPRPRRTDLHRGDSAQRTAWFLDRAARLTPDDLDRLAATTPPPIAFHATIRRFVPDAAGETYATLASALEARVPHDRWTDLSVRDALLGVAAELAFGPALDELLDGAFRARTRERLLRAWEASVDQPRHGPNRAEVRALLDRIARMTTAEIGTFVRASQGISADERPWPASLHPEDDEALGISAALAARDAATGMPAAGIPPATAARARRLLGRLGHVTALRHAFPATAYAQLVQPFVAAVGAMPGLGVRAAGGARSGPDVRRAG